MMRRRRLSGFRTERGGRNQPGAIRARRNRSWPLSEPHDRTVGDLAVAETMSRPPDAHLAGQPIAPGAPLTAPEYAEQTGLS